jgi:hypothetical protein
MSKTPRAGKKSERLSEHPLALRVPLELKSAWAATLSEK